MNALTLVASGTCGLEIIPISFLMILPRLGELGKKPMEACMKAPYLDLLLSLIIWIPWLFGVAIAGVLGFLTALVTQIAIMQLWIFVHELIHRDTVKGHRIANFFNGKFGWLRHNLALWSTVIAIPSFLFIRLAEYTAYPVLVWAIDFPKYKQSEWVNVSRHKFDGLVGHDLIWCLYCDWMTGVYSLGAEMLRNVESFWCPIRFDSSKKCENCQLDFPDVNVWVKADGNMEDVEKLLEDKYGDRYRSWFGHAERK
jgi:hypothetical protein